MTLSGHNIIEEEPHGVSRRKKSQSHMQRHDISRKISPKAEVIKLTEQIRSVQRRLIPFVTCSVCNAKVKKERLPKHLSKIHGVSNLVHVSSNNGRVPERKKPPGLQHLLTGKVSSRVNIRKRRALVNCPRCNQPVAQSRLSGHLTRVHPNQFPQADARRRRIAPYRVPRPEPQPDIPIESRKILTEIEKLLERKAWLYPYEIDKLSFFQQRLHWGKSIEHKHKVQVEKIRERMDNRRKPRFLQGGRVSGR